MTFNLRCLCYLLDLSALIWIFWHAGEVAHGQLTSEAGARNDGPGVADLFLGMYEPQ